MQAGFWTIQQISTVQLDTLTTAFSSTANGDFIKRKHFLRYWPFLRGIHGSHVKSPHKGQWRGALIFSLICARINGWVNNRKAGDLRRHQAHYDVTVMQMVVLLYSRWWAYKNNEIYLRNRHREHILGFCDMVSIKLRILAHYSPCAILNV